MRLLTPLLLTIALCPRPARAQDSPIYLNDNGGIPLDTKDGKSKTPPKAGKRPPSSNTAPWSYNETHIYYKGSIKNQHSEYYIEDPGYRAVCLELSDGRKIDLTTNSNWTLASISDQDKAEISSDGKLNNHIHIEPGKTMWYNPPHDMDDPDPLDIPHGTKNQLKGAKFNRRAYPYIPYQSFIIHYCGPNPGCLGGDDGQTEQCPPPHHRKKQ
jgi:hypothetical protein